MDLTSFAATVGTPFAVVLTTLCAIKVVKSSPSLCYRTHKRPYLYEDKDGIATHISTTNYSDTLPKLLALITALLGLLVAVISAYKVTLFPQTESTALLVVWTRVAAWLFCLAQCCLLQVEPSSVKRVDIGILAATTSAFLLYHLSWEGYGFLALYGMREANAHGSLHLASLISQFAMALLVAYACLSIPRRPDVFHNEELVDGQYTVSILQRYTFGWAAPLLKRAKTAAQINFQDLPAVDYQTRAAELMHKFLSLQLLKSQPLWRTIYASHSHTFWWGWVLATGQSISGYGPQLCLFKTLSLLEKQQAGIISSGQIWFWAIGIGVTRFMQQALEARLAWVSSSQLEVPIRSQLSAIIFQNSMRMKLVKMRGESIHEHKDDDSFDSASQPSEEDSEDSIPMENLEKQNQNAPLIDKLKEKEKHPQVMTNQGTINLLAVDASRVAEFAARQYIFLGIFISISIAIVVLVLLIGWISLCVGIVVPIIIMPLTTLASRAYTVSQGRLMKERDRKLTNVTEALQGIRQIKFWACELEWQGKIMEVRDSELKQQRSVFIWIIVLRFLFISSPILLSLSSLATYAWINGSLSPSIAFTALAVFGNLEFCLALIPFGLTQAVDASVSCKRIEQHMRMVTENPRRKATAGDSIEFRDAAIAWPTDPENRMKDRFVLRNMNAKFPNGELSVISGKSGAGKSLVLSAIIGEADVLSGSLIMPSQLSFHERYDSKATPENWIVPSAVAYVAQIPWIENATLKNNILFGLPFHHHRYHATLAAAALTQDLELLEDGDMTEIGAQGINLSGGQRWRVTLARAIYSRAGILVLDDIFSAVDTSVGRHIFEQGLTGKLCEGRTRILATHHDRLCLPRAAYVVHISNGSLSLEQVKANEPIFDNFVNENLSTSSRDGEIPLSIESQPINEPKVFVEEEFREYGSIRWATYKRYLISSGGLRVWLLAIAVVVSSQLALLGRGWWMKLWTEFSGTLTNSYADASTSKDATPEDQSMAFYLSIYAIISLSAALLEAIKCGFVYLAALRASRQLFEALTHAVLKAPLRWLDTVPLGRILSRMSADFVLIDARIPGDTHTFMSAIFSLVAISTAGVAISFFMIVPELILLAICLMYTTKYLHGAREVKRLESISKSPILELYSTSLTGLDTIRTFDRADEYISRMLVHLDNQSRSSWSFWLITQWMAFRMGVIGSTFALFVAVTIAARNVNASLAGFALGFALEWTKSMEDAIRRFSNLQLNMNSTERVIEFCDIATEDDDADPHVQEAPRDWPSGGSISVKGLHAGYGPGLPDVIQGLNLEIAPGQRIGIVGRTGAGKSSVALSLFRFMEQRSGSIHIDGIDISTIKLQNLRSRLSIIPQDPVLFSGTVRSHLDPFNRYSDFELRRCLDRVCLTRSSSPVVVKGRGEPNEMTSLNFNSNSNLFDNLESSISEGGLNLSQGQRQLLCLARTMLHQSKIVVMDEATSAVDIHTDAHIQICIAEHYKSTAATLIVIAHRISTVADFDKILVMADGKAVEFGEPRRLLEQKGEFWKLVTESGERDRIESIVYGRAQNIAV